MDCNIGSGLRRGSLFLRYSIKRANGLAYITSKNYIAHFQSNIPGNFAFILHGMIGDATTGINSDIAVDCPGRASLDTPAALPAGSFYGNIRFKLQIGDDRTQEIEGSLAGLFFSADDNIRRPFRPIKPSPALTANDFSDSGEESA